MQVLKLVLRKYACRTGTRGSYGVDAGVTNNVADIWKRCIVSSAGVIVISISTRGIASVSTGNS